LKVKENGFKKYLNKHKKKSLRIDDFGIRRLRRIQDALLDCRSYPIKTRAVAFMIIERMVENQNYIKRKEKRK
jgi:hypothetical protein